MTINVHSRTDRVRAGVWLLAALFVIVSFAGCLTGDEPTTGEGSDDTDGSGGSGEESPGWKTQTDEALVSLMPSVLVYGECSIQGLQMHLPAEFFEGDLPEGFEIATVDPLGTLALMEVVALDCPTVQIGTEDHTGITEFRFHLDVTVPEEHAHPDAARHMLLLDAFQSDTRIQELYSRWDLWSTPGNISLTSTDGVAARVGQVTAETPWETFEMVSAVQAADGSCQENVVFRTFGFRGDAVTSYVDVELEETCFALGAGSIVFEPFGTDPESLAFWLLITGATSGLSFHSMEGDFRATQTHTPLIQAVSVSASV